MNIDTELRDLADLLGKLESSCEQFACLADHLTPGQFRQVLLGIGEAMKQYRVLIATTLVLSETPDDHD